MKILRCRACYKQLKEEELMCPDCGSRDIKEVRIVIKFDKNGILYPVIAYKSIRLGRDDFRSYGESYKYLEEKQFEVLESEKGWQIKGFPAKNSTLLNGIDVTNKAFDLKDGDKIKVGNFEVTLKLIEVEIKRS